jgi:hypothetical protein
METAGLRRLASLQDVEALHLRGRVTHPRHARSHVPAGCSDVARHSVGLTPKRWRNHREKALGAVKPSSSDTSVSE